MKILANMTKINNIKDDAMLKLSCKFDVSKWNPYWLSTIMNSTGTNYVIKEHEDVDWYDSFVIPSKIMPYQSYPESLVNQHQIPIDLLC